jgi:hypothetical protein
MPGQVLDARGVRPVNRQHLEAVSQFVLGVPGGTGRQRQSPEARPDRHLPDDGGAQEDVVVFVFESAPRAARQARIARHEPEECVRVEQESHRS